MTSFLIVLGAFLVGVLAGDLIRIGQGRRDIARIHRSADLACRIWSADPANWCDRPGCPRCWGDAA
ncbi:hypothetical protein [Nonomuraea sp. NPDC050540]|uniref:hypothetical protein n=1 Tax=Nonomuraea sp. NPDC050540 TaxID=3364367 RepID=UPI00378A0C34